MSLNLSLVFGSPPSNQEFPGTPKALGDFLAAYFAITGGESFIPVNFGANTPDSDHRGYPWFKTDNNGVPIGWYSWNGTVWDQLNTNVPSGTTAQRPADASIGDLYYDIDISVELIYNGSSWVTASGSPGDMKHVQAATIGNALTKNPGWVQADVTTYSGRVLGAAGNGTGLTPRAFEDSVGEEETTLATNNLQSHQHAVYGVNNTRYTATGVATNSSGVLSGWGENVTSYIPDPGDQGNPINTMQPTIFVWLLVKS